MFHNIWEHIFQVVIYRNQCLRVNWISIEDVILISSFSIYRVISATSTSVLRDEQVPAIDAGLNTILKYLENLGEPSSLSTHTQCKHPLFRYNTWLLYCNIVKDGTTVPMKERICLFGVTLSDNLSYHTHARNFAESASQ